jgi:hypothetical protein
MPTQWSSSFQYFDELLLMLLEQCTASASFDHCTTDYCRRMFFENVNIDAELQMCSLLRDAIRLAGNMQLESKINDYESCLNCALGSGTSVAQNEVHNHHNDLVSCCSHSWKGSSNVWIVKPVGLSCGENIAVVRGLVGTIAAALNCSVSDDTVPSDRVHIPLKCIMQKYIERPLLVRHSSKKFDIRQWLLLTDTNPMVLYGFSECYARLSARDYDIRGDENLSDASMHLCNHSIQKHAIISKLQTGDGVNDIEKAGKDADADTFCETMMTQAQLERELAAHTNGISTPFQTFIVPQIQRIAVDVVDCVKDTLFKRGKGFEWLGIDLMIAGAGTPGEAEAENPWKVLLLEVNVSPDISYSTPVTTRLIPPAVKGMFDIVFADSRERTSIDDDAAASSLKWNKWHTGPILDYLQMRNFSKSKTAVCELKGSGSVKPSGSKSGSAGIGSKKSESAERSDRLQAAVISTLKIPAPSMSGHSAAECHETVRLHAAIGMADADLITQGNPGNLPRHGEVAQVAQSHACISDDEDEI